MGRTRSQAPGAKDRVKLHDVAEIAGVSAQTVSRVVRNTAGVAEDTRKRVLAAVEELGYRPNLAARSLSAGRIGAVHVVVAATLFHGTTRTFVAICEALAKRGLATSTSVAREHTDPETIVPVTADGVIVLGGASEDVSWLTAIAERVPVVYVGRTDGLPGRVSSVAIDQLVSAQLAVRRLAGRGAKRLAHIAGPQDWSDARLRLEGFVASAAELGLDYEVFHADSWEAVAASRLGPQLPDYVDGVFAGNDHLALGYLSHCQRVGRRVPDDVAVIGVDNTSAADAYQPPLTTVRQPFLQVGERAVECIDALLDGGEPQQLLLEPELIIRESA